MTNTSTNSTIAVESTSNSTTSNSSRSIHDSDIFVIACYVFIAIFGCVNNIIIIVIIVKNVSLQTLYNYLLLNLAVADLLSSLFSIGKFIFVVHADKTGGLSELEATIICSFFTIVIYSMIFLSILTLTAIAMERYFGIVKPFIHRNITTKRLRYFLLIAWGSALSAPATFYGELEMHKERFVDLNFFQAGMNDC